MAVISKTGVEKGQKIYSLGAADADFYVSDNFTSLALDASASADAISIKSGYNRASVSVFAAAITTGLKDTLAAKTFTVSSAVGTIYGGAVLSKTADQVAIASKYTGAQAKVAGVNLVLDSAKASKVFGGGAGYGSVVDGDVSIDISGDQRIGAVYGGGQKGAVVNGNVNITVNGKVNVGSISGAGASKAVVTGTKTLEIADYSGKFTTKVSNFDVIKFTGDTAVTFTQGAVKNAKYEFVIDEESIGQGDAMLTWNKSVDLGKFSVTIDTDADAIVGGFSGKVLFASTALTASAAKNITVKTAEGDVINSSMYTLTFVQNKNAKGKATKGGYLVLDYVGSNVSVTDTSSDMMLTNADDRVSIKGNFVRANVNTGKGNDRVTVQTETLMAGDIDLGEGDNVLTVQGDAEMTGTILVSAGSNNTIYVKGTISGIEGGDSLTTNTVYLQTPRAVGYWKGSDNADNSGNLLDSLARETQFIQQDLSFTSGSKDKVVIETAAENPLVDTDVNNAYRGNINFGKGADTLVLNGNATGTITSDDGDDVIVANKSGVTINTDNYRLTGTDNALVIANGVRAEVTGVGLGDYKATNTFSRGIYLGQNAIVGNGNNIAVSSYNGDLNLAGNLTVLAAKQLDAEKDAELVARIGEYYTEGTGVNGIVKGDGETKTTVTLKDGAVINGEIENATVAFEGNAGGEGLVFDGATITVDEGKVATVKSIDGLDTAQNLGSDVARKEADLAKITLADDAQVYAVADKLTVAGPITKDTAFTDNVAFIGTADKGVTVSLTDAKAYVAAKNGTNLNDAALSFAGKNEVTLNQDLTLDNKKVSFADADAEVKFDVLDDKTLEIKGIVNGGTYNAGITEVTLGANAQFEYADNVETASWNKQLNNADNAKNIVIREGSTLTDGAVFTGTENKITVGDGSEIKNKVANVAVRVRGSKNELSIGNSQVYGQIVSNGDSTKMVAGDVYDNVITLAGTKVDAVDGTEAVALKGANDKLVATGALINGDLTGGKLVQLDTTTVTGKVTGTVESKASSIGEVAGGKTTVLGGETKIAAFTKGQVVVDGGVAEIDSIAAANADNVNLRVMNAGQVRGDVVMTAAAGNAKLEVIDAEVAAVKQTSDNAVVKFNYKNDANETVFADSAVVGNVTQGDVDPENTATAATVNATMVIKQTYKKDGTDVFADKNDAITKDAVIRTVGSVEQTAETNQLLGSVTIKANGKYENVNAASGVTLKDGITQMTTEPDAKANKHKEAIVKVDAVTASYAAGAKVVQEGDKNTITAGFDFEARGEADVTVGKSTLTMGDLSQTSKYGNAGTANEVDVTLTAIANSQAVLTLNGDLSATVGKVEQVAYKNDNKVNFSTTYTSQLDDEMINQNKTAAELVKNGYGKIVVGDDVTLAITVASIQMLAYAGDNVLTLDGNVKVEGDIVVGGVLNDKNAAWGDRTANLNDVTVDVSTVTVGGNVTMIGLANDLTINNNALADGKVLMDRTLGQNVYIAGENNNITIDLGVKTDNIHFYDLTDWEQIGVDGYDIGTCHYTNGITLRGAADEIIVEQTLSNDKITVEGGTVAHNIETKNSGKDKKDEVIVKAVAATKPADTVVLGRDASVGGNVTMGGAENKGQNTLTLTGAKASFDDVDYVNVAKIGGNVEMTSNDTNTLTAGVNASIAKDVKMTSAVGNSATLDNAMFGDALTMNAKKLAEADADASNDLTLKNGSSIAAATILNADASNQVSSTESAMAALTMTGATNTVDVYGASTFGDVTQTGLVANTISLTPSNGIEPAYATFGAIAQAAEAEGDDVAINGAYLDTANTKAITQKADGANELYANVGTIVSDELAISQESDTAANTVWMSDVDVTGNVFQKGLSNSTTTFDGNIAGSLTQDATTTNEVILSATAVDAEFETTGEDEECGAPIEGDAKCKNNHNIDAVVLDGDIKTKSAGKIVQKVTTDNTASGNVVNNVALTNVSAEGISQETSFGNNTVTLAGDSAKVALDYVGEIGSDTKTKINRVVMYKEVSDLAIGAVAQNGENNTFAGSETKAKVTSVGQIATIGNAITTGMTSTQAAYYSEAAYLDNKEVFTLKKVGENAALGIDFGAITQELNVSDNFDDQKTNTVDLVHSSVDGSVVQKVAAGATDANVKNEFTTNNLGITSTTYNEIATDELTKALSKENYKKQFTDTIGGDVIQSGFENTATLFNTNVDGKIEQTTTAIKSYVDHTAKAVVADQKAAGNELNVYGADQEANVALKVEAKKVSSVVNSVIQTVDNAVEKAFAEDEAFAGNTLVAEKAEFGTITQTATNGNNSVSLTKSSAKSIVASNVNAKIELAVSTEANPQYETFNSTVTLRDSEVTSSITSGVGDDIIDLYGETKITGTIDMGDNSETGFDKIAVNDKEVDLSEATIKNVETISAKEDLKVTAIDTAAVKFEGFTNLYVTTLTVGNVTSDPHLAQIQALDDKIAVNYTFKGDIDYMNVKATTAKDAVDKLVIGEANVTDKATVYGCDFFNFEEVTFQANAELSDNCNWKDTTTGCVGKIDFDLTNVIKEDDKTTPAKENEFVLGSIEGYKVASDLVASETAQASDITFSYKDKDYTRAVGATTWTNASDKDHAFKYDGTTVTYTTIS